jgi:hypothetical protein
MTADTRQIGFSLGRNRWYLSVAHPTEARQYPTDTVPGHPRPVYLSGGHEPIVGCVSDTLIQAAPSAGVTCLVSGTCMQEEDTDHGKMA